MNAYTRLRVWLWESRSRRRQARLRAERGAGRTGEPEIGDLLERRGEWLFRHLPRESAEYIYDLHSKGKQRALARTAGMPVAEVYVDGVTLRDALAALDALPHERFVLKPNHGRNSVAVFCLAREGSGYRDLTSGSVHTTAQLGRRALRAYEPLRRADEWLVEELLLAPTDPTRTATDFKFYCFGDRAELVRQRVSVGFGKERRVLMRHYDRDGVPVDTGLKAAQICDDLELPASFLDLRSEAERVSAMITTPFMRVDLYDSHRGVVLGELTPGPGGMYSLNPEWKERFTRRWHESARALETALANGTVQPLVPSRRAELSQPPTRPAWS